MTAHRMSLSIDDADGIYRRGSRITGRVTVEAYQDNADATLFVETICVFRSVGRWEPNTRRSHEIAKGSWQPGQTYEYAFDVPVHDGPSSYDGKLFSIYWSLTATTEPGVDLEEDVEQDILVASGVPNLEQLKDAALLEARTRRAAPVTIAIIFAVFIAIYYWFGFSWFLAFFAVLVAAALKKFIIRWFSNTIGMFKLGKVRVQRTPLIIGPGQQLDLVLRITPRSSLLLNATHVTLSCEERVKIERWTGTGKHARLVKETRIHQVYRNAWSGHQNRPLSRATSVDLSLPIAIPADGPCTIRSEGNELVWPVELSLDIADCPDWSFETEVIVVPEHQQQSASPEQPRPPSAPAPWYMRE